MGTPSYRRIVILTGAGISAESGIQTFRAADGLWENHRVEDVASPEGFQANPELVQRFYNERRRQLLHDNIQPNPAHHALAALELCSDIETTIITQNIDHLHELAGSQNVIHMHGELLKMRCSVSGEVYSILEDLDASLECACCHRPGQLRPHIVWFGEIPLEMEHIYQVLAHCDLFIAIGTSGHVYPAAGFVREAALSGAHTIDVNLASSAVSDLFAERIYGCAGTQVPLLVGRLLR